MIVGVDIWAEIVDALSFSFGMLWAILWALILGFALSGVVQAAVSKKEMQRLLPDDRPRTLVRATALGAASSSCSYAAVALSRSLFRRGADFTSAMAFEIASTNLVAELAIVIALLLGWEFVLGEFVGGPLMIIILAIVFRRFLKRRLVDAAREQANKGLVGSMEGHAEMDMSADVPGTWSQRLRTPQGFTATADYFVMDWAAIWRDIAIGLLVTGALAAWVPDSFWQNLFLTDHETAAKFWGPVIGPIVAMISFVCSVGNVPLAAVLWNGGISFGGVIAFLFGDLIIVPDPQHQPEVLRPEDGRLPARSFYFAMVLAGLGVELLFEAIGIEPTERNAKVTEAEVTWNYTTFLNIVFLGLAAVLVWRYFRRGGGLSMLKMMNEPAHAHGHDHHCH